MSSSLNLKASDKVKLFVLMVVLGLIVFFAFIFEAEKKPRENEDLIFESSNLKLPEMGVNTEGKKVKCPSERQNVTCRVPSTEQKFKIDKLSQAEFSKVDWQRFVKEGHLTASKE